jgi:predicted small integral membrane protein
MPDWIAETWDEIAGDLAWMAWTWATAIFFAFILFSLITLTLLAVYRPETPRKGILGFPTTRGDRFFVSLLGSAYIFILWIRFDGGALWYPLGIAFLFGVATFIFA